MPLLPLGRRHRASYQTQERLGRNASSYIHPGLLPVPTATAVPAAARVQERVSGTGRIMLSLAPVILLAVRSVRYHTSADDLRLDFDHSASQLRRNLRNVSASYRISSHTKGNGKKKAPEGTLIDDLYVACLPSDETHVDLGQFLHIGSSTLEIKIHFGCSTSRNRLAPAFHPDYLEPADVKPCLPHCRSVATALPWWSSSQ